VEPVLARPVPLVRRLADHDRVRPVRRGDDREAPVLLVERRVIRGRQLEALTVQDGDVWVEERGAEAHPLDLDADALALFGLDRVVVHVLVVRDAVDGHVERDLLRGGEVAVRLLLLDHRQGPDPERAQFGDAGGGTDAQGVLAEPRVRGDLDRRLHLRVVDDLKLGDGEARRVEDDFLGVLQIVPAEDERGIRPPLRPARLNGAQRRRGGEQLATKTERAAGRQQPGLPHGCESLRRGKAGMATKRHKKTRKGNKSKVHQSRCSA
jgi:hypothetical protein